MSIQAGFAETDITPPVGTEKAGWLKKIVSERVLDPIMGRVAVFESHDARVAFIGADLLSIRWTQVAEIRARISAAYGFPGSNIMVAATHNHAGPAMVNAGDSRRDAAGIEHVISRLVAAFGQALENRQESEIGFGSCFDFDVGHNRRVVLRDGTVRTHGSFSQPDALFVEGPIDPEVAVLAARGRNGRWMGALVNYACHPTQEGEGVNFSAGYPGVLAQNMKRHGCPVPIFLNGASGNVHTSNPIPGRTAMDMMQAGARLAEDAAGVMAAMTFRNDVKIRCRSHTLQLPYRRFTDEDIRGTVRGAQRFIDPAIYDRGMPALVERIRTRGTQPAEVQAIALDEVVFVAIPAEYFVEHGLRIKEKSHPRHALVVGGANGMVGYVPTRAAFDRGGYETTFAGTSRMAPEAGDMLADAAIDLVRTI